MGLGNGVPFRFILKGESRISLCAAAGVTFRILQKSTMSEIVLDRLVFREVSSKGIQPSAHEQKGGCSSV